ncbi:MAG: DRTGG domain-containing protein [Candidatus Aminicenantales bacterium]|jgi:predicted transcriptional regulator
MLTLKEVQSLLAGELLTPGMSLEKECLKVFASDMMSDVLAFIDPESVLVTGLITSHVVRTACLADVSAIVLVQGKRPEAKVIDEAMVRNLPIISTPCSMFEVCSRISRSFPEAGG